ALGGVDLNIEKGFKDKNSGADFQAGEQTLNGEQALAFVRTRYAFAQSDLARTKNQQKFLSALANQAATPGTILNPFKLYPTLAGGLAVAVVVLRPLLRLLGDLGALHVAHHASTLGLGAAVAAVAIVAPPIGPVIHAVQCAGRSGGTDRVGGVSGRGRCQADAKGTAPVPGIRWRA
ncbi:LCP family protein, partial [Streptomyces sp. MS191]|uniref:LCP family protein n=1 Tax=Streptomyces sp. ms191 TaxID=1827978 RepID=UPI0021C660E4